MIIILHLIIFLSILFNVKKDNKKFILIINNISIKMINDKIVNISIDVFEISNFFINIII